jgi:DNA-binding LytR/AlgR family response regulator
MKLKCIITDDEPMARKGLQSYIEKLDFMELVAVCEDAIQLSNVLKTTQADVLLLDIEMPYMSGIELLSSLANPPKVIITSAYEQYAIKGYDLEVVDYLLKPISFDRFLKAVNKVYDLLINQQASTSLPDYLFVKANQKLEKIFFKDILFVEGVENYVSIQTTAGKVITHSTLSSMLLNLPASQFVQAHKSFIVNMEQITTIEGNLLGVDKYTIPVSRTYRDKTMETILKNKLLK